MVYNNNKYRMITDVIIDIHDNMRGVKTKFDMIRWKTWRAFGLWKEPFMIVLVGCTLIISMMGVRAISIYICSKNPSY